ncbi:S-adenosyl methyltransferase [Actinomadura rubteroloni]|uniref:S-adenosyl methyltransferase n=1 Tax=Actinomadura rubteroloni TaxID=1926885 RepID=A0A2P4UKD0_9ACTN|nr:SAM-dependent methyltransferase [Actinomadura rubteroloni]POM25490.1 S-adenosyl methyltransferase [Actinomadura rubteroloni]
MLESRGGRASADRVWNYWLGGKDHYHADRDLAAALDAVEPALARAAREQRAFLGRALDRLAGPDGMRQFLDVSVGLPAPGATHTIVQRRAPGARVVYAGSDPVVLSHARALLTAGPGPVAVACGDVADPAGLLAEAGRLLDLDRPVALVLGSVLEHVPDDERARTVVEELVRALAPGSHVVLAHLAADARGTADRIARRWNDAARPGLVPRCVRRVRHLFNGLDVLDPGIVPCAEWRAPRTRRSAAVVTRLCGVGRVI